MNSEDQEYGEIMLPNRILNRVERRVQYTEFDSSEAYVTYVLEEILYRVEDQSAAGTDQSIDEDNVKDRLRSLGYLDE